MNEFKSKLISEATETFSNIYPCGSKSDFDECFTMNGNHLLFWFNTEDQSTHIISMQVENTVMV
jgi:hypothetical protein